MLSWTAFFVTVALISGSLGFSGSAGAATGMAKILCVIFLVHLVVSLVERLIRGGR